MPRYFFNTDNGKHEEDLVGVELPDAQAARIQAVLSTGEYLRDNPGTVWGSARFIVKVRDEGQALILTVTVEAKGPVAG